MSGSNSFPARRRAELVDLLRHRGQATITELAEEFVVSEDTIRRDLDRLAEQGLLERTHGGATVADLERLNINPPFARRLDAQSAAKDMIGRAAARLVEEGHTVFINGGTTTLAMARHLASTRGITVVTNNLPLPELLYGGGAREVYVLGGSFRVRSLVTIGPVALPDSHGGVQRLHGDIAFIGVGGIGGDGSVTTTSLPEAGMMRAMMESAERSVLLADATKFGRVQFAEICHLAGNMTLITEIEPPAAIRQAATDVGCEIIVAT